METVGELDRVMSDAVARGDAPFLVAAVCNRDEILWQGSAGRDRGPRLAGQHTVFRIFSMTKAVGSLAAVMLVDRGVVSMDTPVASMVPEFGTLGVLERIGAHGSVLRAPRSPVTLGHLLTHTSGLAYGTYNSKQKLYQEVSGLPPALSGRFESLRSPLVFDPGDGFAYGIGLDWVGRVIEAVDGRSVDAFCREEIFEPLGMSATYFEPDSHDVEISELWNRVGQTEFERYEMNPAVRPEFYGLGGSLYSTAADYLRFLRLIINDGVLAGHRIVGPGAMRLLRENQLGKIDVVPQVSTVARSADIDPFPGVEKTHTAGFMRLDGDVPGMRRPGSLFWAGTANTHYWVDPGSGLAAVFMTQLVPFGDGPFMTAYAEFERAVYDAFGSA